MSAVIRWGIGLRCAMVSASAILLVGCVGQAVVGEEAPEDEEPAGDGDEGGEPVECSGIEDEPQPSGPPMNDFGRLAGTVWEGYFEGGADVTVVLGADGTGTYYFGEKRDFAPPTDPDTGYLCETEELLSPPCSVESLEGFPYSIREARLEARRLRFTVSHTEPWNEWCALQTPFPTATGCEFSLLPEDFTSLSYTRGEGCSLSNIESSKSEPVDCGWATLAVPITCECNSQECFSRQLGDVFDLTANEEFTELSNTDGLRLFLVE